MVRTRVGVPNVAVVAVVNLVAGVAFWAGAFQSRSAPGAIGMNLGPVILGGFAVIGALVVVPMVLALLHIPRPVLTGLCAVAVGVALSAAGVFLLGLAGQAWIDRSLVGLPVVLAWASAGAVAGWLVPRGRSGVGAAFGLAALLAAGVAMGQNLGHERLDAARLDARVGTIVVPPTLDAAPGVFGTADPGFPVVIYDEEHRDRWLMLDAVDPADPCAVVHDWRRQRTWDCARHGDGIVATGNGDTWVAVVRNKTLVSVLHQGEVLTAAQLDAEIELLRTTPPTSAGRVVAMRGS